MKHEAKCTLQLIMAVVVVAFGCTLIATSFWYDPRGVIDASVLAAYGEALTFAGSIIGVDYHYRAKRMPPDDAGGSPPK